MPSVVDDGIEVDIAAIAIFAEQRGHLAERAIEEALGARIGDDRAHFASELAEIAGKEALVFPIEAGGFEKVARR